MLAAYFFGVIMLLIAVGGTIAYYFGWSDAPMNHEDPDHRL